MVITWAGKRIEREGKHCICNINMRSTATWNGQIQMQWADNITKKEAG